MADTPEPSAPNARRSHSYALFALCVAGINIAVLFGYLGRRSFLLNPVWIYLAGYALAFLWYVYAAGRVVPRLPRALSRAALIVILTGAVVFRLSVLFAPPSLSTDMYRYVWDGRLTLHGINPYRWTPNAQTLRDLRDPVWQQMEYKPFQTIYMPVSQLFFAISNALFGNHLIGYKVLYFCFDIGVIGLLLSLLTWLHRPPEQIIWYAWCPLPVTEISLAGHQDIVGVFFLLLALHLFLHRQFITVGGVALAASILTKGFALVLLPLFARSYGRRFVLSVALALLYLGMPLWVYLPEFLHGMKQYLDNVHVNAGLFHWANMGLSHVSRYHYNITAKLSDIVIGGAALWAARRPASSDVDILRRAFIVLSVTLLAVPTLFPWYLIWPLALMPLLGRRPSYALVLLTGLSVLLYTFYLSIRAYWWTPLVEYGPFYALLAYEYWLWRHVYPQPNALHTKTLEMPRWMLASALRDDAPTIAPEPTIY